MAVWYEEGLRFECTACGRCCIDRGDYAFVFLNRGEEKPLARALGLTVPAFLERYTQGVDGLVVLENGGEERDRCIFLQEGRRCRVYEARPLQCRTWPFWPENLLKRMWEGEIAPSCPGVGRGRLYSRPEIEEIAYQHRARELLTLKDLRKR